MSEALDAIFLLFAVFWGFVAVVILLALWRSGGK